ncbi:MAG TPA: metallophosphoesterase [Bryobacteraceae bacterium]|nr:metallophosphoesterase [Bryobacteraceae bacterium]
MFAPNRREFLRAIAIAFAGTAAPSQAAPASLVRFPHVQNVTRTRAVVRWTTREPGAGAVEFASADSGIERMAATVTEQLPRETGMQFAYYRYEVNLQKLKAGTEYTYRVLVNDSSVLADPLRFRTAGTQAFRFVAFGDSGMGSEAQAKLANLMMSQNAKLVVHTGDLVYPTGTYERYEKLYFEYYKDIMKEAPFYPCPGNHDYYEFHCAPYKSVHSLPTDTVARSDSGRYYSYDWSNVHFISLDSNDSLAEAAQGKGEMLEWLEKDLQSTDKFWRVVYLHHPAYSVGFHKDEPECEMVRQYIAPILDKYFVPLVLNGHEHSYQRTFPMRGGKVASPGDGTVYVTTGGGGADLHEVAAADHAQVAISQHHYVSCNVNGGRLQLDAINTDGQLLDSHSIAPKPLLAGQPVVNSANYGPMLASGGLMTIFGQQFSPEEFTPAKYPLPKSALGVSVLLNDQPLPILMASARQLNLQLPFDAVGEATLSIRTPNGSAAIKIAISRVAPAIFAGAMFHANGLQLTKETPAAAGEMITTYLTGLGAVTAGVAAGEASPPNIAVTAPVVVKAAGIEVNPHFAGLAAGLSGVYAVTFRVPAGLRHDADVYITAAGFESNKEVLFVA